MECGWTGRLVIALFALFALCACDKSSTSTYAPSYAEQPPNARTEYVFGVHPLHNPERLNEVFGPMVDALNREIPEVIFRLEASRNYAAFDKKLYSGAFDFALPNPYQTVESLQHDHRVFGKMADNYKFRGIILARKDSGIAEIADLKGKAVAFPAPTALAATMMPQAFLHEHGLKVGKDFDVRYVGSQESSIMNVYLGEVAAAATWPPPWELLSKERPELEEELEVVWETESLVNNGLVVHTDVPAQLVSKVSDVLFSLHTHDLGRDILSGMGLSRFEIASKDSYAPVVKFLESFSQTVRHLD